MKSVSLLASNRRLSKQRNRTRTTEIPLPSKQISSINESSTPISFFMSYKLLVVMICVPFVLFFLSIIIRTIVKRKQKSKRGVEQSQSIVKNRSTSQLDLRTDIQENWFKIADESMLINMSTISNCSTVQLSSTSSLDDYTTLNPPQICASGSWISSVSQHMIAADADTETTDTETLPEFDFDTIPLLCERLLKTLNENTSLAETNNLPSQRSSENIYIKELMNREIGVRKPLSIALSTDDTESCL
ncbi:hypothetical protein I4U23_025985 [Adineta vaga]|nr:hypothetical protein I4U23_025985 [Adineta vaga]